MTALAEVQLSFRKISFDIIPNASIGQRFTSQRGPSASHSKRKTKNKRPWNILNTWLNLSQINRQLYSNYQICHIFISQYLECRGKYKFKIKTVCGKSRRLNKGWYSLSKIEKQYLDASCGKLMTGKQILKQETKQRYESTKMVSGV